MAPRLFTPLECEKLRLAVCFAAKVPAEALLCHFPPLHRPLQSGPSRSSLEYALHTCSLSLHALVPPSHAVRGLLVSGLCPACCNLARAQVLTLVLPHPRFSKLADLPVAVYTKYHNTALLRPCPCPSLLLLLYLPRHSAPCISFVLSYWTRPCKLLWQRKVCKQSRSPKPARLSSRHRGCPGQPSIHETSIKLKHPKP